MKRVFDYVLQHRRQFAAGGIVALLVCGLLWYRLGSLTVELSPTELTAANVPLGWHGLYHHPFFLPLLFLRSIVFFITSEPGNFLIRLPNTLFGVASIISFAYLIKRWHGLRTAVFATALFATSAWLLHASRLASSDVVYLSALPLLLCSNMMLQRHATKAPVLYGSMLLWGALLYVPGLIWLVTLTIFWQKRPISEGWRHFNKLWQRLLYVAAGLIWLPLLLIDLARPSQFAAWLGAPQHFAAPLTLLKQLVGVFVHLFIRGPQYPDIWLGRVPILDIFVLVMSITGIYFYATHRKAVRSKLLLSYFAVSVVLVAVHGTVPLSLLVPLLYIVAATGITYLLYEWLQVFPLNPFARSLGIALISVTVLISCVYNVRAYFVAWPHNAVTKATFHYHR